MTIRIKKAFTSSCRRPLAAPRILPLSGLAPVPGWAVWSGNMSADPRHRLQAYSSPMLRFAQPSSGDDGSAAPKIVQVEGDSRPCLVTLLSAKAQAKPGSSGYVSDALNQQGQTCEPKGENGQIAGRPVGHRVMVP